MAKILPFRPEPRASTKNSRYLESKDSKFPPIARAVVINNHGTQTDVSGFPEAWRPFIRWPNVR